MTSQRILCYFNDDTLPVLRKMFPDFQFVMINDLPTLYKESLDGFAMMLLDHKKKITQKIDGLDKFIFSLNGHNIYGVQNTAPTLDFAPEGIYFLQYYPLKRFSAAEFLAQQPWAQSMVGVRKFIRLNCPVSVEVFPPTSNFSTIRTYSQNISLRGIQLVGDFRPKEELQFTICGMDQIEFKGIVKWSAPWGKFGIIPAAGIEILHQESDYSYKKLKLFIEQNILSYMLDHAMI